VVHLLGSTLQGAGDNVVTVGGGNDNIQAGNGNNTVTVN
jgi:hypothetical protein